MPGVRVPDISSIQHDFKSELIPSLASALSVPVVLALEKAVLFVRPYEFHVVIGWRALPSGRICS